MALFVLVFAMLGIQRENQVLMYLFMTGIFFLLFYNGFLLSRIFDPTLKKVSPLIKVVTLFWGELLTHTTNICSILLILLNSIIWSLLCTFNNHIYVHVFAIFWPWLPKYR